MKSKDMTPLSHNINYFIGANSMSKQEFADEINKFLSNIEEEYKVYTTDDIFAYINRNSVPKDQKALVAISKIINKPLKELLLNKFSREELVNSVYDKKKNKVDNIKEQIKLIKNLSELPEDDYNFLVDLVTYDHERNENDYLVSFELGLNYDVRNKKVIITLCYGFNGNCKKNLEFGWEEYAYYIDIDIDIAEAELLEHILDNEIFGKYNSLNIIKSVFCFELDKDEYSYTNFDKEYLVEVNLSIDSKDMFKICKVNLERAKEQLELAKKELERLEKERQLNMAVEN